MRIVSNFFGGQHFLKDATYVSFQDVLVYLNDYFMESSIECNQCFAGFLSYIAQGNRAPLQLALASVSLYFFQFNVPQGPMNSTSNMKNYKHDVPDNVE